VLFKLSRQPGMRQIELADMLDIEPITLSRIVDRLEEGGLVERVADPVDRRAWRLHVTARAQPLIAKLRQLADEMTAEAFAGIDPEQIEIMRQVLGRVRENASRAAPTNRASNE
jgi:DNA-binding MarR family transcriptional regulator